MKFKKGQMVMTWIHPSPLKISKVIGDKVIVKGKGVQCELDANSCTPI